MFLDYHKSLPNFLYNISILSQKVVNYKRNIAMELR